MTATAPTPVLREATLELALSALRRRSPERRRTAHDADSGRSRAMLSTSTRNGDWSETSGALIPRLSKPRVIDREPLQRRPRPLRCRRTNRSAGPQERPSQSAPRSPIRGPKLDFITPKYKKERHQHAATAEATDASVSPRCAAPAGRAAFFEAGVFEWRQSTKSSLSRRRRSQDNIRDPCPFTLQLAPRARLVQAPRSPVRIQSSAAWPSTALKVRLVFCRSARVPDHDQIVVLLALAVRCEVGGAFAAKITVNLVGLQVA